MDAKTAPSTESVSPTDETPENAPPFSVRWLVGEVNEVIKMRLTVMVLLTTLVGFYMGSASGMDLAALGWCLLGTGMVAAAAAALNQYFEREVDRQMERTKDRPLAAKTLPADEVVVMATSAAVIGCFLLATLSHLYAGVLAALTIWLYLSVYTPLKRKTAWNTLVGAVPGALPPVIGYVAASGRFDLMALSLFGILFLWQMPHFLAIAWLYKEDYARGGFVMTPLHDPQGVHTGFQAFIFAVLLVPISLLPWYLDHESVLYLLIALVAGIVYTAQAWRFMLNPTDRLAKQLFFASILYLPVVMVTLVACKS